MYEVLGICLPRCLKERGKRLTTITHPHHHHHHQHYSIISHLSLMLQSSPIPSFRLWQVGALGATKKHLLHWSTRASLNHSPNRFRDVHIMGVEPKIYGKTPQIIHFNRVFHYFHHPFWGFSPNFWKHPYPVNSA